MTDACQERTTSLREACRMTGVDPQTMKRNAVKHGFGSDQVGYWEIDIGGLREWMDATEHKYKPRYFG